MNVNLISFGKRYGHPKADITIMALSLPNPYGVKKLRELTGLHDKVYDHVVNTKKGKDFVDKAFKHIISKLQTKSNLTVAIGCIGGKHRSVAVVRELQKRLDEYGATVSVKHRDMKRK